MGFNAIDALVAFFCLSTSSVLYRWRPQNRKEHRSAYILSSQVTHARLLPAESAHAFTYPTLSLLLSLSALERHSLDLSGGWVFGYGGLYGRLTGIRPSAYLTVGGNDSRSIQEKLVQVLVDRGFDAGLLEDAWMMTMPSILGYESINPLTVYYCYNKSDQLWAIVLEVHNTFGERHVYILEVGKDEDSPANGFDHQWTFARHFHVSPFNDRMGFYTVCVTEPSHAPVTCSVHSLVPPPRPLVRIHYHPPSSSPSSTSSTIPDTKCVGPLKLSAVIRPVASTPLTTWSLIMALVHAPFALFLTFPRILYQAWILHYIKRLDVVPRPEPKPAVNEWYQDPEQGNTDKTCPTQDSGRLGGGIGWQKEGMLESFARRRIETFLKWRVRTMGIQVTLVSANASVPPCHLVPHAGASSGASEVEGGIQAEQVPHLKIYYLSSRFFTIIFTSPSAAHALLLGRDSEKIFFPSSSELFLSVFNSASSYLVPHPLDTKLSPLRASRSLSIGQRIRLRPMPLEIVYSPNFPIPVAHPLDASSFPLYSSMSVIVDIVGLSTMLILDYVEKSVFTIMRARFIPGEEPWKAWDRAVAVLKRTEGAGRANVEEQHDAVIENSP